MLKSNLEQLKNRGLIPIDFEKKYLDSTLEQQIIFLQSAIPTERTLGAKLLSNNPHLEVISFLIDALKKETKLYPKIAICESLASFKIKAVPFLINVLGEIGNNQHKFVPTGLFKKDNYPLPRDIVSRILVKIGPQALPSLLNVLDCNHSTKVSEAIDAIGFICYYDYKKHIFEKLKDCYNKHSENEIIKWKIFIAMSSFPESKIFLEEQSQIPTNFVFLTEIQRSLRLISKNKKYL